MALRDLTDGETESERVKDVRRGCDPRAVPLCERSHKDRVGGGEEEKAGRFLPWSSPLQAVLSVPWLRASSSLPAKSQA